MPYIADEYRDDLEKHLVPLAEQIKAAARDRARSKVAEGQDPERDPDLESATTLEIAGFLNYACSRLVAMVIPRPLKYSSIALFSGVLRNVSDEFYRRVAVPYEDEQMKANGDVYPPDLTERRHET